MADPFDQVRENLASIRGQIAEAARRVGRDAAEVTLVGVTKYVDAPLTAALVAAGCTELGESRPQQLWAKAEALKEATAERPVHWHLVGHLQRNKIRRTLPLVRLIHSVDSIRLLDALEAQSVELPRPVDVLLEVNVSGEGAKHGLPPQDVAAVLEHCGGLSRVRVRGLMTMAGQTGDPGAYLTQARRQFASLRQLREALRGACPPGTDLKELSMGMSGDFQVAVEEGATMVRIGSSLFEGTNTSEHDG